jgi:hypothetical protein
MPQDLTTWDLPALLPIREEGVLQIFITLKNPSPSPGSNLQPLSPVASTLTTTPPRRRLVSGDGSVLHTSLLQQNETDSYTFFTSCTLQTTGKKIDKNYEIMTGYKNVRHI